MPIHRMRNLSFMVLFFVLVGCSGPTSDGDRDEKKPVALHPDFPVVDGRFQMTEEWSVDLPTKFNRRMEEGSLVLWKPGFTIWLAVWGNDNDEPADVRLKSLRADSSPDAFDSMTESNDGLLLFSYRLLEVSSDTRQAGFYGFAIGASGHVQMAIYFDTAEDIEEALQIWRSLTESKAKTK